MTTVPHVLELRFTPKLLRTSRNALTSCAFVIASVITLQENWKAAGEEPQKYCSVVRAPGGLPVSMLAENQKRGPVIRD